LIGSANQDKIFHEGSTKHFIIRPTGNQTVRQPKQAK